MSVATTSATSVSEFYHREVLPRLIERLDLAFPEFHWRRTEGGWVADNQHSYVRAGGRPHEMVTCPDADGFSVSGRPEMTWLAYVNGGRNPQGAEYVSAVRHLAELAGVDASPLVGLESFTVPTRHQGEQYNKLNDRFFQIAKRLLDEDAAAEGARQYLARLTGLDAQAIGQLPLGYYTNAEDMQSRLLASGFRQEDIDRSALLCHGQLNHCIIGPARNPQGPITTFFALELFDESHTSRRYLNLGGGARPVAFGLDVALTREAGGSNELILIQGLVEAVSLHRRNVRNVAAIAGGASLMTRKRWEGLSRHGVKRVTLAIDREADVVESLHVAAESLVQSTESPLAHVLEPELLADCETWHEWFLRSDRTAQRNLLSRREHLFHLHARILLDRHRPPQGWTDESQRSALIEALEFDALAAETQLVQLDQHFWPVLIRELPLASRLASLRRRAPQTVVTPAIDMLNYEDSNVSETRFQPVQTTIPKPEPRPLPATPIASPVVDELAQHEAWLASRSGYRHLGLTQRTLPSLDRYLNGLRGLTLLAGGPQVDKLSLAIQLGIDAITQHQDTVFCCFSFDQPKQHVMTRVLCRLAGIDWNTFVRSETLQNGHATTYRDRLATARERLTQLGSRFVLIDREECPDASFEQLSQQVDAAETTACVKRAIVVVDDLPVAALSQSAISPKEDWAIDQLRRLRDHGDDRTVIGLCDAETISSSTSDPTSLITNRRARYAADAALILRPFNAVETRAYFSRLMFPSVGESRWIAKLQDQGVELNKLLVVKGDENRQVREIELAYSHRRFSFSEEIPTWGISRTGKL